MRIAHLPANFFPYVGGTQVVVHNLAAQQHKAGHKVFLLTRATRNRVAFLQLKNNLPYTLLPVMARTISVIRRLQKLGIDAAWLLGIQIQYYQWKYKFDVWHVSQMGPLVMYALPFLKKMGVPVVGTCHGIDIQKLPEINYGWRLNPDYEKRLRKALLSCHLVTAISHTIKNDYKSLGIPEHVIRSIPNGINFNYIKDFPSDEKALKHSLNLPADKKIIITVGRNHPKKGYKYIPEIIRHITQTRTDILWVIVGQGAEEIGSLAHTLGVAQYLKFLPVIGIKKRDGDTKLMFPSGDLIGLYKAADVFAFPTLIESFGLVNIEAMAAGLPAVVTNAPGCIDLVRHKFNGLVSPVRNTKALADHILEVLGNEFLKNALIENGLEEAEKYDWENIAQQYIDCYQEAIAIRKHKKSVTDLSTIESIAKVLVGG